MSLLEKEHCERLPVLDSHPICAKCGNTESFAFQFCEAGVMNNFPIDLMEVRCSVCRARWFRRPMDAE